MRTTRRLSDDFETGNFHLARRSMCARTMNKCRIQEYRSAQEVIDEISVVQKKRGLHIIVKTEIS